MRFVTDSPFIRGDMPVKLTGTHLQWMTDVSVNMKGSSGITPLLVDGVEVGEAKAIGGIIYAYFSVSANTTIKFPDYIAPAPCFLSDGTVMWPTTNNELLVLTNILVHGWYTYRG